MSEARAAPRASARIARGRGVDTGAALWRQAGNTLWYLVVVAWGILFLVPFVWMLSTSFKVSDDVFTFPPNWIPIPFQWQNYVAAWDSQPTALFFRNSLTVTVLASAGDVLSSSLVAFGFARLRFRGSNVLFILLLSTMILPEQVTLIPLYLLFKSLGWLDTFLPLIVPHWFANPLYTFLLRQFFMTVPREVDDAAKIDGCGFLGVYWRIVMPLAMPALGVVAMFSVTSRWTEFTQPLIYLNSIDNYTIALGLTTFQSSLGIEFVNQLMAISTLAILPIIVLFFFGQRFFIRGVVLSGMR